MMDKQKTIDSYKILSETLNDTLNDTIDTVKELKAENERLHKVEDELREWNEKLQDENEGLKKENKFLQTPELEYKELERIVDANTLKQKYNEQYTCIAKWTFIAAIKEKLGIELDTSKFKIEEDKFDR